MGDRPHNGRKFEELVAELLREQGFAITLTAPAKDAGVDIIAVRTDIPQRMAVQLKRWTGSYRSSAFLRQAVLETFAAKKLLGTDSALLVVNSFLSDVARRSLEKHGVSVWDANKVNELWMSRGNRAAAIPLPAADTREHELQRRLTNLDCGLEHWQEYEEVCVEILNHLFRPPLGVPQIQLTSDDGLDRRDAIYKIGYGHAFWDALKAECRSRLLVTEFKNSCERVNQVDVESLQQYLYSDALRSLGLLCSRQAPTQSATLARRRAWKEFGKLILFASDAQLIEMLEVKAAQRDPTIVLDDQIDEFFATLTP